MKKEVIAISLVFLIISTSFVGAVEISDLIEGQAKIQDLVKDNEQQEPEDILINVESYQPRVVPSYAFESEQFGGYNVIALLTGIQTNPLIDIPRIRSVRITSFRSDVPGVILYTKRPTFGTYTLDNLGYVVVRLPQIKDERKIPQQININVTAALLYDVGSGFGVNEQDLILPQLAENEFLLQKEKYSFWSGRGYVKLDSVKNGQATLSIYDGRAEKVRTVTLNENQVSSEMFLSYGNLFPNIGEQFLRSNLRDRFKIRLNNVDIPRDKAKVELQINDKFIIKELVEGNRLYDGSNWRVKRVYTQGNDDIVELYNERENKDAKLIGTKLFTYQCSDYNNNKDICNLLIDCQYQNNLCIPKTTQTTVASQQTTQLDQTKQNEALKLFTDATKTYTDAKEKKKSDLATLKPIINDYANILNNYKGSSIYAPTVQYYTEIWNNNQNNPEVVNYIDQNYPGLQNIAPIQSTQQITQTSATTTSTDYYNKAVEEYKRVVSQYTNLKDKDKRHYAEEAQKQIVEIYDQKLFKLDKALEEYKYLLANFELDALERRSIENRIKTLESRSNYVSTPINLQENENTIIASIVGLEKTNLQTEIIINYNGKDTSYKIGDKINENWIVDSILNLQQVRLAKTNNQTQIQETKIISINDKNPIALDAGIAVLLKNINTKNEVSISVLPGVEYLTSISNFKLHIPVEKRLIQFSDKQIDNQIEGTKKTIEFLNNAISKVEKVYKYFSYFCWTIFGWITIKSLFFTGSRTLARDIVIKEYTKVCNDETASATSTCTSKDRQYCLTECILSKSVNIENDIDAAEGIIDKVKGDNYKKLIGTEGLGSDFCIGLNDDECRQLVRTTLLSRQKWNDNALTEKFIESFVQDHNNIKKLGEVNNKVEDLRKKLYDSENKLITNNQNQEVKNLAIEAGVNPNVLTQNDAEKILKYKKNREIELLSVKYNDVDYYNGVLDLAIGSPEYSNLQNLINLKNEQSNAAQTQVNSFERFDILIGEEDTWYYLRNEVIREYLYEKIDNKLVIYSAPATKFNEEYKTKTFYFKDNQEVKIVDNIKQVPHIPKINLEDSGKCSGDWIKRISVDSIDYVEVTKRAESGDCTPIEFSVYRRNKANEPLGGGSGVQTGITIDQCQEGKQRYRAEIKEYCDVINKIQFADRSLVSGKNVGQDIPVGGIKYLVENGILQGTNLQCYNIMDPSDCKLLFTACDPVVCPVSRFNAGGKWFVNNVVASGIFGSIFLGTHLWGNPEIGICMPGVLAGLKNYKSIAQGYQQCLEVKKTKGENVGICDTIRSVGVCRIIWREAVSLFRVEGGLLGIFSRNIIDAGSGGGEYAFFTQNIKKTGDFLDFFTSEYATTYFNAFRGGSTEELGDQLCEAAIYGKLPGPGSLLDQLTRPEGPPQFIATLDEFPHSEISGESLSDYSVYYHIYAGESYERVAYTVWLESSTLNLGRLIVTREGALQTTAYLNRGDFADLTIRRTAQTGYDQICVEINRVKKCGFGKVSTEFSIDYAQEQITKSQLEKRDITSEAECKPDKTIVQQTSSSGLLGLSTLVSPSGTTYTGVRRECGIEKPGKSVKEEQYWIEVGTCGKDAQGRDLGKCWLDQRSTALLKNQDNIDEINKLFEEDAKTEQKLNELDKEKENLITEFNDYSLLLNGVLKDDLTEKKSSLVREADDLVKKYREAEGKTLNPLYSARALFSIGEIYQNLADTLRAIETKEKEFTQATTQQTPSQSSTCISREDCQKLLGNVIINEARKIKQQEGIEDSLVTQQTGAKNFECLALQLAYHESKIHHCGIVSGDKTIVDFQKNGDPLYCDGNSNEVLKSRSNSVGVMQININVHKNLNAYKFLENVPYGINYLADLYKQYKTTSKQFTCPGISIAYSGWKAALRNYNGWACTDDNNYVENVINNRAAIEKLFPETCGAGATVSSSQNSGVNSGALLPIEIRVAQHDPVLGIDWWYNDRIYEWDGSKWDFTLTGANINKYNLNNYEGGLEFIKNVILNTVYPGGTFDSLSISCGTVEQTQGTKRLVLAIETNINSIDIIESIKKGSETLCKYKV